MLNRLEIIEERYNNIQEMLQDAEVVRDVKKLTALMKEMRSLEKIVERYHEYKSIRDSLDELKLLAADTDPEISEMAKMELDEAQERYPVLEEELKILLIDKGKFARNRTCPIAKSKGATNGELKEMFEAYANIFIPFFRVFL